MKLKHVKSFKGMTIIFGCMVFVLFLGLQLNAAEKQVVEKSFAAKKAVVIKTVSGDCIIEKGAGDKITVKVVHTFSTQYFEPIFKEEGDTLVLEEKFKKQGEEGHSSHHGESTWTVIVPENTKLESSSASGDVTVKGTKSDVRVKTASGDIHVENSKGFCVIKTASGDIDVQKAEGNISVGSASGDVNLSAVTGTLEINVVSGEIHAEGIHVGGNSAFKSVSGDVEIKLVKSSDYNMELATVSGDIQLDYAGNTVKGYFEFKGQKGNIDSDIALNDHEGTNKYNPFVTQYFKQGGDSPKVTCETVSGSISFKK